MIHTALSATHMVDISLRDPGGGEMIKVRLQGTKEDMEWLEKQLSEYFGTKVKLNNKKIEISYEDDNDLNRILEIMNYISGW